MSRQTQQDVAAWLAINFFALLLGALLWPSSAEAGSPRYRTHEFTIAEAACPTGNPGVAADGLSYGMSLSGLAGWKVTVCPAEGKKITGTGKLLVCTYSPEPWGVGQWALSPEMTWDMESVLEPIGGESTTDNPCVELSQLLPVVALSDRVFVYPSQDFGSDGTTLTVKLTGETR